MIGEFYYYKCPECGAIHFGAKCHQCGRIEKDDKNKRPIMRIDETEISTCMEAFNREYNQFLTFRRAILGHFAKQIEKEFPALKVDIDEALGGVTLRVDLRKEKEKPEKGKQQGGNIPDTAKRLLTLNKIVTLINELNAEDRFELEKILKKKRSENTKKQR